MPNPNRYNSSSYPDNMSSNGQVAYAQQAEQMQNDYEASRYEAYQEKLVDKSGANDADEALRAVQEKRKQQDLNRNLQDILYPKSSSINHTKLKQSFHLAEEMRKALKDMSARGVAKDSQEYKDRFTTREDKMNQIIADIKASDPTIDTKDTFLLEFATGKYNKVIKEQNQESASQTTPTTLASAAPEIAPAKSEKSRLWDRIVRSKIGRTALVFLASTSLIGLFANNTSSGLEDAVTPTPIMQLAPTEDNSPEVPNRVPATAKDVKDLAATAEAKINIETGYDINNIHLYRLDANRESRNAYGPAIEADNREDLTAELTGRTEKDPELMSALTVTCLNNDLTNVEKDKECRALFSTNSEAWRAAGNEFKALLTDSKTAIDFYELNNQTIITSYRAEDGTLMTTTKYDHSSRAVHIVNEELNIDIHMRLDCGGQRFIPLEMSHKKITKKIIINQHHDSEIHREEKRLDQKNNADNVLEKDDLNEEAKRDVQMEVNTNEGNMPDAHDTVQPDSGDAEPPAPINDLEKEQAAQPDTTLNQNAQGGAEEINIESGKIVKNDAAGNTIDHSKIVAEAELAIPVPTNVQTEVHDQPADETYEVVDNNASAPKMTDKNKDLVREQINQAASVDTTAVKDIAREQINQVQQQNNAGSEFISGEVQ